MIKSWLDKCSSASKSTTCRQAASNKSTLKIAMSDNPLFWPTFSFAGDDNALTDMVFEQKRGIAGTSLSAENPSLQVQQIDSSFFSLLPSSFFFFFFFFFFYGCAMKDTSHLRRSEPSPPPHLFKKTSWEKTSKLRMTQYFRLLAFLRQNGKRFGCCLFLNEALVLWAGHLS